MKYEVGCNSSGEWFVFDNEDCYCVCGPMGEEEAIEEKIKLDNKGGAE